MSKFITVPIPADLPENWDETNYVSPGGVEVGLTQKHGYNYLMKQVNNSQKAITELGTATDYMIGVNMLDNSYFADPVRRGLEKYAVAGASYYEDATFAKKVYTLKQDGPLTEFTDAYGAFKSSSGNNTYYVKPEDVRDGYAADGGAHYVLPRWKGLCVVVERGSNGISIRTNYDGQNQLIGKFRQYFTNASILAGKTITVSALIRGTPASGAYMEIEMEKGIGASYPQRLGYKYLEDGMNTFTIKVSDQVGNSYPYLNFLICTPVEGSFEIEAMKVELGPYQTLAHQDASGAWILNEIPNKALETVKCNYAPVEMGGIGMIVSPEDIGIGTANVLANAEVV